MQLKGSYRTTLAGVAAILTAVGGVITGLVDNDPATPDWTTAIAAVMAGVGLIVARDNKVNSEDVGAK